MRTTTAEQLVVIEKQVLDQGMPVEQTTALIESGALAILCQANFLQFDLDIFCQACGLDPAKERERRGNRKKARKAKRDKSKKSSLLKSLNTTTISATTSPFVAKEKFVCSTSPDAPVKISYLGDNFTNWFLSGDSKIEDPISEQTLRYYRLRKSAHDVPLEAGEQAIIPGLGGETKAETTLSEIYALMQKQGKGEKEGALLTNGYANIFYVRDVNGVLRAVGVDWRGGGWAVYARFVGDPDRWNDGHQVFSRNSVLESSVTAST